MTDRLREIFSSLPSCNIFADVGCDHGYIAKAMLDSNKCNLAVVSDISAKCLQKAQTLLKDYVDLGRAESVVSDGLKKINSADLVLIAGMGGEEIVAILENAPFLPERLVLQPMKNCDKVRVAVVNKGYRIEKDYCFSAEKKYYDLIVLTRGEDSLTEEEIEFGRTNILQRPRAFLERNKFFLDKYLSLANDPKLSEKDRESFIIKARKLQNYV